MTKNSILYSVSNGIKKNAEFLNEFLIINSIVKKLKNYCLVFEI